MTSVKYHLLWVDDQIEGFASWVEALVDSGFVVTQAKSTNEARALASANDFDVALVDLNMPDPDGIECLRMLRTLLPETKLAAFSSYLYLDRYRTRLEAIDGLVELIDKDLPPRASVDFDARFILPIRTLVNEGPKNTVGAVQSRARIPNRSPFDVSWSDFLAMSILEKDRLSLDAREAAREEIDKAFRSGKCWILLCGSDRAIRASAVTSAEVYSEQQILEFGRIQNRVPFQFWRPMSVEDIGWSACEPMGDYPTVTLELPRGDLQLHFDTGSPITFFSYECLLQHGFFSSVPMFSPCMRGSQTYWAASLDIHAILKSQTGGTSKEVRIYGQAVREWLDAPYKRICGDRCAVPGRMCAQREALVGRNLLVDNKLRLVLDGVRKKTTIA